MILSAAAARMNVRNLLLRSSQSSNTHHFVPQKLSSVFLNHFWTPKPLTENGKPWFLPAEEGDRAECHSVSHSSLHDAPAMKMNSEGHNKVPAGEMLSSTVVVDTLPPQPQEEAKPTLNAEVAVSTPRTESKSILNANAKSWYPKESNVPLPTLNVEAKIWRPQKSASPLSLVRSAPMASSWQPLESSDSGESKAKRIQDFLYKVLRIGQWEDPSTALKKEDGPTAKEKEQYLYKVLRIGEWD